MTRWNWKRAVSYASKREQVCADRGGLEREDNLHHVARHEFEQILDRTLGIERQPEHEPDLNRESESTVTPQPVDLDDTEEEITLHLEIDWMTEMLLDPDGEGWRSLISGDTAPSGPEHDHNRGRSVEIEAPAPDSDESFGRGWDMDR